MPLKTTSLNRLENKVAIISGAASGIGRGTAQLFIKEGAKVVIADINQETGEQTAQELGPKARFKQTDVTNEGQIKTLVDFAINEFGKLDIMFNNAGALGARGSMFDISSDGFDATFALLVKSGYLGMKYAGLAMKKQGHGVILNTASIAATTPGYGPHIYQAAKAAILQLSKSVALEYAEYNIRVNCVSPGGVYTPLIGNALGVDEDGTRDVAKLMAPTLPLNRTATPMDIANAALFLCSDEASYITAQNLVVDGAEATGKKYSEQGLH